MRELNFKAWDYIANKMYGPYTLTELISDAPTELVDVQDNWRVKPWLKFLQFTGFTDKDDTEVYEGDVLTDSIHGNFFLIAHWIDIGRWVFAVSDTHQMSPGGHICDRMDSYCGSQHHNKLMILKVVGNTYRGSHERD